MARPIQWDVTLIQVENGFLVRVGCKNFVFANYKDMSKEVEALFSGKKTTLNHLYNNDLKSEGGTCEMDTGPGPSSQGGNSGIRTLR